MARLSNPEFVVARMRETLDTYHARYMNATCEVAGVRAQSKAWDDMPDSYHSCNPYRVDKFELAFTIAEENYRAAKAAHDFAIDTFLNPEKKDEV